MDSSSELINKLLYSSESDSVDFKREQYKTVNVNRDEKGELIKDILAFANSWHDGDCYIVVGIEESEVVPHNMIGVSEHPDDAAIQQLLNGKTNTPISVNYSKFEYGGVQVGIFTIPNQKRPVYLVNDYGKLKKDTVYVRRGSSTVIANPDEIGAMALQQVSPELNTKAVLDCFFAERSPHSGLKKCKKFDTTLLKAPSSGIPDHVEEARSNSHNIWEPRPLVDPLNSPRREYYRELYYYLAERHLMRPIDFCVVNTGNKLATGIKVELQIYDPEKCLFMELASDMKECPKSHRNHLDYLHFNPGSPVQYSEDIDFKRSGDYVLIRAFLEKIHAEDRASTGSTLFIGSIKSGDYGLIGKVFADELSKPQEFDLSLAFEVTEQEFSLSKRYELLKATRESSYDEELEE